MAKLQCIHTESTPSLQWCSAWLYFPEHEDQLFRRRLHRQDRQALTAAVNSLLFV